MLTLCLAFLRQPNEGELYKGCVEQMGEMRNANGALTRRHREKSKTT